MPFDLGDTARLSAECRGPDGELVNAGAVTLTVTLPDGTASVMTPDAPASQGLYVHDFVTTQPGRHSVRWVWSAPSTAYTDMFDVRPAEPELIISLADAKAHLNLVSSRDDDELRGWLESVTAAVEHYVGAVVRRTVSETHSLPMAGVRAFVLHHSPVLDITSVANLSGGQAIAAADLHVDPATGIVRRAAGGLMWGPVVVTYTVGRQAVPAAVRSAALIILQHLWRTQRGSTAGPVLGGADDASVAEPIAGIGYAVPYRALQLMEPYRLPPGVA